MKRKIIMTFMMTIVISSATVGCSNEDLSKYGVTTTIDKNSEDTAEGTPSKEKDDTSVTESQLMIEELSNDISTNSKDENDNVNTKLELTYPSSLEMPSTIQSINDEYLNEIINYLNSPYFLQNGVGVSQREKDELISGYNKSIEEYKNFIANNQLSYTKVSVNYQKEPLYYFLDGSTFMFSSASDDDMKRKEQRSIAQFIAAITREKYSEVLIDRERRVGFLLYNPSDIVNYLCTYEISSNSYITESEYERMNDYYNWDLDIVSYFLNMKNEDGEYYFKDLEEDIKDFFKIYKEWIDLFKESKSIINNNVRYYNETMQQNKFNELESKREVLKKKILERI